MDLQFWGPHIFKISKHVLSILSTLGWHILVTNRALGVYLGKYSSGRNSSNLKVPPLKGEFWGPGMTAGNNGCCSHLVLL